MTPLRSALLVCLAAFGIACGGGATPSPVTPKEEASAPATSAPKRIDAEAIIAAVVKVRGLPQKQPIQFKFVSDEEFVAHARAQIERRMQRSNVPLGASDPAYLLAYYDISDKVVFLRERSPEWARDIDVRALVAHEVEHALQDQHYDLAKLLSETEIDVARAHLAVVEGDAEATAVGVEALFDGLPPKRAIVRGTAATKGLSSDLLVASGMVDPRVGKLKPHEREELIFPYREGASFVGAILRTGGFALVDQVFQHLPSSTAEILHPQVSLEGPLRNEVAKLDVPPTFGVTGVQGAAGELGLRNVLVKIGLDAATARDLATAWRGDRIVRLQSDSGRQAFAWAIVCADEEAAVVLQQRLDGGGRVAVRARHVIGLTEGIKEPAANELALRMTKLPLAKPKLAPPLDARTIAPVPPSLEATMNAGGSARSGVYRQPNLGLKFTLAPEMALRTTTRELGILDVFAGHGSAVVLSISDSRPTPQTVRVLESGVLYGVTKYGPPGPKAHVSVATGYGRVEELRVSYPQAGTHVRVSVIPICKNEASLTVTALFQDEAEVTRFVPWIDRIRATLAPSVIDASPFCRAISAEHTTDLP